MDEMKPLSFQHLPVSVRYRIYGFLGARRPYSVDLTVERRRLKGSQCAYLLHPNPNGPVQAFPIRLMRTCRLIYRELNEIIYGSHNFMICLHEERGRTLLPTLGHASLAQITNLLIHFSNPEQCGLDDFRIACETLAEAATLSKLELTVFGENISDNFIEMLHAALSKLSGIRACNLRLTRLDAIGASSLDRPQILKQLSIAATGGVSANSFRLDLLPPELQREVLKHTGLILPQGPIGKPQGLEVASGMPRFNDKDTVECCRNCTGTSDWLVCCCRFITNDAYSASCTCYRFPLGLLEQNDTLSNLAHDIACSENRIVLRGDPACSGGWLYSQPVERLFKIRSLDILITCEDLSRFIEPYHKASFMAQWEDLVHCLSKRLKISNVALSINASYAEGRLRAELQSWRLPQLQNPDALTDILMSLIVPFATQYKDFRHLRNFFVYWPFNGAMEKGAEQAVMGDEYDSEACGKIAHEIRDRELQDF